MRERHDTDPVAYVRFASVYRSFKDIANSVVELEELLKERKAGLLEARRDQAEKESSLFVCNSLAAPRRKISAHGLPLGAKSSGPNSPNPQVGAVMVRRGKIVGTGYHQFAGGDHAEIAALKRAGARARGATLYITLEPCSHQGRTPPCTGALIRAGIKEIVCGTKDPNPLVGGRGFRQLRRAGIKVRIGVLEKDCRALIEAFAKYITRRCLCDAQVGGDTRRQDRRRER